MNDKPTPAKADAAVTITFLGGQETGNVDTNVWGNTSTHSVEFPVRQGIVIDPAAASSAAEKQFLEDMIRKARNNRFYKVEDGRHATAKPAQVTRAAAMPKPGKPAKPA